jgi:hypothetical protein
MQPARCTVSGQDDFQEERTKAIFQQHVQTRRDPAMKTFHFTMCSSATWTNHSTPTRIRSLMRRTEHGQELTHIES